MKIAMIGAGSVVFCKTLIADILATPALQDADFALMAPTETKLRRMESFVNRMIGDNGFPATCWATTDRQEAIRDADFVVVMIQVGGMDAFGLDYEIPLKYGVDQCIGDTLGPGGVFRAQRHIPILVGIAEDMQKGIVDRFRSLPMSRAAVLAGRTVSDIVYNSLSIVVMTLPIALPMVTAAGFDPIWFGIYLILMVELSQITPPVGFNLFVIQGLTDEPIMQIAKYAFPFFLLMLLTTAIVTVFPEIALFLPKLMTAK